MSDQRKSTPAAPVPSEVMLRRTWAWRFEEEHLEPLQALGETLRGACQEARWWGRTGGEGVVCGSLHAAADDLEGIAEYFAELAVHPVHSQVSEHELAICREAQAWSEILREYVEEIRDAATGEAS